MYYVQNISVVLIMCMFVNSVYTDTNILPDIREKGIPSNNVTVHAINNTIFPANKAQKSPSFSHQNRSNLTEVASEGGIISSTIGTHYRRENVMEQPAIKSVMNKTNGTNNLIATKPQDVKPVQESVIVTLNDIAPQQDDEKPSVPKKGVSFHDLDSESPKSGSVNVTNKIKLNVSDPKNTSSSNLYKKVSSSSNITSSTNSSVIHKKPLVTESDSDFINISKSNEQPSKETISLDQIDPLLANKKNKRSDYIVPIVAVILSVPLVAILASVLYKRGTDWWQHRNYKRMDFLIEGMYHN